MAGLVTAFTFVMVVLAPFLMIALLISDVLGLLPKQTNEDPTNEQ